MRILLAVDGSRSADQARDLVAALPLREGGLVRIVSVAPTRSALHDVPSTVSDSRNADDLEEAAVGVNREALAAAEREIRSARSDLVIEPVMIAGRPASVIVAQAREMTADLVVVGHRGLGRWDSVLLGTVASEVVDHAPCPVLVARDERLAAVVLAYDGSPDARSAECVVSSWPLFEGLPITVVSVAEAGSPDAETSDPAAGRLREAGMDVSAQVRTGDPAEQIIGCTSEFRAELVVVGRRGQTGSDRLIMGSVARNVLLHAPCSVLVVRDAIRLEGRRIERRRTEREQISAFG
jgi:nucleotide-binding universal stress UspA family protein